MTHFISKRIVASTMVIVTDYFPLVVSLNSFAANAQATQNTSDSNLYVQSDSTGARDIGL